MLYDDTIAAIATPPGSGGLCVIRISGAAALPVLEAIFRPRRAGSWHPYRMRYGAAVDAGGAQVDEGLAVFFRGPRSFTAEDSAEISCHGGPLVARRVLGLALLAGARHAEAGEFTMRAFLNGRIDLAQAEATLDVIAAQTDMALNLAQGQLGGWLSGAVGDIRETLLAPLAYVTALVDFPEDEVEPQPMVEPMADALTQLEALAASAEQGVRFRDGARAVLVGRPNAGKSSLLNALLRIERAIVTPIPGTTRDTLEETASLGGVPVVLTDTAGITESADPVERIGVERSHAALSQADLALLVVDVSAPIDNAARELAALIGARPAILVLNKIDALAADELAALVGAATAQLGLRRDAPTALVSALTGEGIDALAQLIAAQLLGGSAPASERLVASPRHRDALLRAAAHVRDAIAGQHAGLTPDLLAIDLTAALAALGEITGDGVGDDLLSAIFSRFCIGK